METLAVHAARRRRMWGLILVASFLLTVMGGGTANADVQAGGELARSASAPTDVIDCTNVLQLLTWPERAAEDCYKAVATEEGRVESLALNTVKDVNPRVIKNDLKCGQTWCKFEAVVESDYLLRPEDYVWVCMTYYNKGTAGEVYDGTFPCTHAEMSWDDRCYWHAVGGSPGMACAGTKAVVTDNRVYPTYAGSGPGGFLYKVSWFDSMSRIGCKQFAAVQVHQNGFYNYQYLHLNSVEKPRDWGWSDCPRHTNEPRP